MIHKTMVASAKAVDEAEGIVEAYTNTMGVMDADGDIVEPTAFNASISDNLQGHRQGGRDGPGARILHRATGAGRTGR